MIEFAVLLSIVFSITHFFAYRFSSLIEKYHTQLLSLTAGFFVTFIFIHALPELIAFNLNPTLIFFLVLIGFVSLHSVEKYLYQHIKNKDILLHDLDYLHLIGFFLDSFIVGVALFISFQQSSFKGLLIFIPLLLYITASSISLNHLFENYEKNPAVFMLLSLSPVIGSLTAYMLLPAGFIPYIYSLIIGVFMYVVFRDMLPEETKGNLAFFLLGFIILLFMFLLASPFWI